MASSSDDPPTSQGFLAPLERRVGILEGLGKRLHEGLSAVEKRVGRLEVRVASASFVAVLVAEAAARLIRHFFP